MIVYNTIKEILEKSKKETWENLVINSIEPGDLIKDGFKLPNTIYYVKYTCSNVSEFFPDASSRRYSITITESDINEYISKKRVGIFEELGI